MPAGAIFSAAAASGLSMVSGLKINPRAVTASTIMSATIGAVEVPGQHAKCVNHSDHGNNDEQYVRPCRIRLTACRAAGLRHTAVGQDDVRRRTDSRQRHQGLVHRRVHDHTDCAMTASITKTNQR